MREHLLTNSTRARVATLGIVLRVKEPVAVVTIHLYGDQVPPRGVDVRAVNNFLVGG